MTLTSKFIKTGAFTMAAVFSVTLVSPAVTLAATNTSSTKTSTFCKNLPATVTKVEGNVKKLQASLTKAEQNHVNNLLTSWANWDKELKGLQAQWQQDRNNEYTELMSLATTSSEKAAVVTFEDAVNTAVNTRETNNQAARVAYRGQVLGAVNVENGQFTGAEIGFINSAEGAIANAQTSCKEHPSEGTTIKAALDKAIQKAKTTYTNALKADEATLKKAVSGYNTTKEGVINKNGGICNTAVKAAMAALLQAFGAGSSSGSSNNSGTSN